MQLFTKENVIFALAIIAAIPVFKDGLLSLAAWNHQWSMTLMEREVAFTRQMRDDNRAYFTFIAKYLFMTLAFLAINVMFSSIGTSGPGDKLLNLVHFISGGCAYFYAVFALGSIVRVEKADDTIRNLQEKLAKLRGGEPHIDD